MEVEVMMPSPPVEFNIDSPCTSPYISAPSSPPRFGTLTPFFSAPTSPSRSTTTTGYGGSPSAVPFNWEERPGVAKTINDDDADFAFDFSGQLEKSSLPADELFHGGKIKPLKPPPRILYDSKTGENAPKSPKSPKKLFKEAFSPKHKSKDFDPFAAAIENTRHRHENNIIKESANDHQRGRERKTHNSSSVSSSPRDKGSRSVSPLRVSDLLFDQDQKGGKPNTTSSSSSSATSSNSSSFTSSSTSWYRKWKLKDLLLFRSASEGRATSKAQLNKYAMLKKTASQEEDVKNASFRSTDSVGSGSRRRSGPVSAHELHYTTNRAVSEEMKRKTFLPYKQGLLGCLGFNPAITEISRGIGSMNR